MALNKHHLFTLIVALIPLLFFVLLEAGLRVIDYGGDQSLFVPASREYAQDRYLTINRNVAQRYFPGDRFIPRPAGDVFLKIKPVNGYRVFVLGGSTVAGWPYPNSVMFSRRLQQQLTDTFPGKVIEVISLGIAAVNSHTLLDFTDEVLAQQPDAILIYAGHNEFYGALGAASTISLGGITENGRLTRLYLALQHSRVFRLLGAIVNAAKQLVRQASPAPDGNPLQLTLMGRVIGDPAIAASSATYKRGLDQFSDNLRAILAKARRAGVPVLLSELVSNVRDQPPFFIDGDAADSAAAQAYREARRLEAAGDIDTAREYYYRAKDLDGLRFRAPEALNRLIHLIADEAGAAVVPMKAVFETASPNGLIGNEIMLDHLHPNADGYRLMAQAFFDAMRRHDFITSQWPTSAKQAETRPYTELDTAIGKLRAIFLKDNWPFRPVQSPASIVIDYRPRNGAEAFAKKVVQDTMTYETAHLDLAHVYHLQGNDKQALREYQALINCDPLKFTTNLAVVTALVRDKAYRDAESMLARAESIAPNNPAISHLKAGWPVPWLAPAPRPQPQ
jgi:lysophospholipase L1-like esterase